MTKRVNGQVCSSTTAVNFNFLKNLANSNLEFFKTDKSESAQKFVEHLSVIVEQIDPLLDLVGQITDKSDSYDFSPESKGNGYLSWIKNTYKIVERTIKILEEISSSRSSYFFRRDHYLKEIAAYSEALDSLHVIMDYMALLMSWSDPGSLFPNEKHGCEDLLASQPKYINQYCFYGRCLGFQFCDSMATILKALCILMASFSEVYYSNGELIDPIVRGSKYWIDPELRAKRIVNISQYGSADFCKNFWFLGEMELMHRLPSIVLSSIQVTKAMSIEPKPLIIQNIYGKEVDIPIPSSHIGPAPIGVRLMSASLRLGMEVERSTKSGYKFPSDTLVFHCHGGGFVAQSSKSHESYLRQWAIGLDVPILSVDYSLAPEAPYPRALEEVFYTYCWALLNAPSLGTTAQTVILAGDSAGANLNIGLTMMCLEYGVRPPNGLFLAYVPVILTSAPSPSRLLTFIDPLLPFGFILGCSKAYACSPEVYNQSMIHERKLRRNICNSQHAKPESGSVENGSESDHENSVEEAEEQGSSEMSAGPSTGIISRWVASLSNKFSSLSPSKSFSDDAQLEEEMERERHLPCPLDMLRIDIPMDPYISPYFASDSVLSNFPPVSVLTTEFDPFLDDCVQFAKKLKKLGVQTKLDVLPGLSHGFLNFSLLSNDAYEASKLCMERINDLIKLNSQEESAPAEECI